LAQQIGADGIHLLQALEQSDAPVELSEISSVQVLRQVWQQYYDLSGGKARWRAGPQASEKEEIIRSPYDPEAQTGKKREVTWLGYKVHLTETCAMGEGEQAETTLCPHLIVQVQTTVAPVQDVEMTATIQEELAKRDLLPEEQIVDTGYVAAELLESLQQKHGIRLVGPV
jgi:transposase